MSSCDGWPSYVVDVEHLADRSMRLWLREGGSRTSLGTVARTAGLGHVVERRVAHHLALPDPEFAVELHSPRPPYVRDGDRVTAHGGGRSTEGVVVGWIEGEVLVDPIDFSLGGGGLFPPEDVVFPGDRDTSRSTPRFEEFATRRQGVRCLWSRPQSRPGFPPASVDPT